jgi:hypothetical protein
VKSAIILVVVGALLGYLFEHRRFEAYKDEVKAVAEAQVRDNEIRATKSARVNERITNDYKVNLTRIRSAYAPRVPDNGASSVPSIPNTTTRVDESATDSLTVRCAETTLQAISLQQWLVEQQGIYNARR